jgi:hypothetical protein
MKNSPLTPRPGTACETCAPARVCRTRPGAGCRAPRAESSGA